MTLLLVLARALHIGSALLMASLLFFRLAILRDESTGAAWRSAVTRRLRKCLTGSFVIHLLSGLGWWWIVTATMNDFSLGEAFDWGLLRTVLLQTQFGQLWLVRAGLALAFGLVLFTQLSANFSSKSCRNILSFTLSVLLLVSLTWAAHAAAGTHARALHIGVDLAHLAIAAVWPVGLVPLALLLHIVARSGDPAIIPILRRFSRISLAGVILLLLTGIVNALFFIPSWSALVATPYGQLLLGKIALFLLMAGIGAANRFSFLPALGNDPSSPALGSLRRAVIIESTLCLVVILIVGVMGATSPPIQSGL